MVTSMARGAKPYRSGNALEFWRLPARRLPFVDEFLAQKKPDGPLARLEAVPQRPIRGQIRKYGFPVPLGVAPAGRKGSNYKAMRIRQSANPDLG